MKNEKGKWKWDEKDQKLVEVKIVVSEATNIRLQEPKLYTGQYL